MHRYNKLLLCFSYIFMFLFLNSANAAEIQDYESFITSPPLTTDHEPLIADTPHQLALLKNELENAFSPAMEPEKYWGLKALSWTAIAGATSFIVWQGIVPMGMWGWKILGITEDVIASGTPAGNALLAATAIPVLVLGIAASRKILYATEKAAPLVIKAQEKTQRESFTSLERGAYPVKPLFPLCKNIQNIFQLSAPTKGVQLFLWGGLGFAFLYDIESHVTNFGPAALWQYLLGSAWVGVTYVVIVRADRNPNENRFIRRITDSSDLKALDDEFYQAAHYAKEYIKLNGPTEDVRDLGVTLNAVMEVDRVEQDFDHELELEATQKRYETAFKRMKKLSTKITPCFKTYDRVITGISEVVSPILQLSSLPLGGMTIYYLMHQFSSVVCNASPEVSKGVAIAGTILAAAPLVGSAVSGIPSMFKETYQTLRLWKPTKTINTTGGRIMTIAARAGTLIYVVLPLTYFADQIILRKFYGMDNLGGEMALVVPLGAVLWSPTAQFIDDNFTWIFNWSIKGAPITGILPCSTSGCNPTTFSTKLLCCVDSGDLRKDGLDTLENMMKFDENFQKLKSVYKKVFLGHELGEEDLAQLSEGSERAPLLPIQEERF